jgi:lysophospholipase L1-like esterase
MKFAYSIILILFFLAAAQTNYINLWAQNNFSNFERENGIKLVSSGTHKVYCIGNSLTSNGVYAAKLNEMLGSEWKTISKGISGQTSAQILGRLYNDVINPGDAEFVVILAGINDINSGSHSPSIIKNLQKMYDMAHDAGIKTVAVSLLPFKGCVNPAGGYQAVEDTVNAWILNTSNNVDYRINAFPLLENPLDSDALLPAYDAGDHLHLNAAGYYQLAKAIYNGVNWEGGTVATEFTVGLSTKPTDGGTVTGYGRYNYGNRVTVSASARTIAGNKFQFVNWTENGIEVSKLPIFSITLTTNRNFEANFTLVTNVEKESGTPGSYSLKQNYPNPFNPMTKIHFSMPKEAHVKITVFNSLGQEIRKLIDKELKEGNYSIIFNGLEMPSGIYFYKIQSGNFTQTKKMILMK